MNVDAKRAFAEAAEAGIDLDLIDANLRLSVAERWRQHDAALKLALRLQQAKRTLDERADGATPTDQ
ncbi:MAG TPA: hypothetical protein VHF69_09840 [Candidatus Synoicihabitans sp.]|nr:hypothetical protein [Candidatus Synoicihabitans sp.]